MAGVRWRLKAVGVVVTGVLAAASCGASSPGGDPMPRVLRGEPTTYRATLTDPVGDDRGPGSYVYPRGAAFPDGTFDLTRVTIAERGDDLEVTVEIRGEFREWDFSLSPHERARALPQVIDIYVDQDGVPGSGLTRALPGRFVRVAPASAWEKVLVVASPSLIREAIAADADREAGKRAVWPIGLRIASNRVVARFPIAQTGRPTPRWGYVVTMAGASYVPLAEVARRLGRGTGASVLRDVRRLPGACSSVDDPATAGCSFGGCAPCGDHPRVIDVIVPPGRDQRTLLSAYRPGRFAELPAVYPFGASAEL
jgi:glucoamylase